MSEILAYNCVISYYSAEATFVAVLKLQQKNFIQDLFFDYL